MQRNPYVDPTTAFDALDVNRSGMVGQDEIRYVMERRGNFISQSEARSVAKKMDFNRDGVVTHGEFVESVRPRSPARRM